MGAVVGAGTTYNVPFWSMCHHFVESVYSKLVTRSSGFGTNEALCLFSYETPYLGPEGVDPVDYQLYHYNVWNHSATEQLQI